MKFNSEIIKVACGDETAKKDITLFGLMRLNYQINNSEVGDIILTMFLRPNFN